MGRHVYSKEGLTGRHIYSKEGWTGRHVYSEVGLTVRHIFNEEGLMVRHIFNEEGLMVRHVFNEEDLTVRHTPAFGHPSPRGDGLTHHIDNQQLSMVRCRAIPSRRGVPRSGGVCRTISPSTPQTCRTISPSTPQTYRPLKCPLLPSPNSVSAPHHLCLLSACCPLDVRLLSALKADNKRTSSGQQADNKPDNKRTSSGQQADNKQSWSCNTLVFKGRFSGSFGTANRNKVLQRAK